MGETGKLIRVDGLSSCVRVLSLRQSTLTVHIVFHLVEITLRTRRARRAGCEVKTREEGNG